MELETKQEQMRIRNRDKVSRTPRRPTPRKNPFCVVCGKSLEGSPRQVKKCPLHRGMTIADAVTWLDERKAKREINLKREYGITPVEFEDMLISQDWRCAICGKPGGRDGRFLKVDHNHVTKANRGLLCHQCNVGLGMFKENPYFLGRASAYLAVHKNRRKN